MRLIIIAFLSDEELIRIHQLSFRPEEFLREAETIGCFYCTQLINYSDIIHFTRGTENSVGICPNCDVDSLIPLDGFDSRDYKAILSQMRFEFLSQSIHFKKTDKIKGKSKKIYLYQEKNTYLMNLIQHIDNKLSTTGRLIGKNVYYEHDYTIRYLIPFKNEEIILYPIEDAFVNKILPNIYRDIDFSLEYKNILNRIREKDNLPSFIIIMPESLSEKESEHVVKLLGLVFGGYFAKISDVPISGQLNQEENIFINQYQGSRDIINKNFT